MKKLIFALCLVLLSGAAWGQTIYKHGGWTLVEYPDLYSVEFIEPRSGERYAAVFEKKPLAESRYRLEKNEVTGRYRITERVQVPKEGTPQGVINEWIEVWNGSIITYSNKQEANEYLNYLRTKEQAEKAWRPIR